MINRRRFLLSGLAASLGISLPAASRNTGILRSKLPFRQPEGGPVLISTWEHGLAANAAAVAALDAGGTILDAVEAGGRISEADPHVNSVGYGGLPDSSGEVTLDACIMDWKGNAGSVAYLKEIMHPVSVARKVMEETEHVMLVGKGAQDFALDQGFSKQNLLTGDAFERWKRYKKEGKAAGGHDTIGIIGMDAAGRLAGACTTSGMSMKLPGRVGDSPIIGAGLYVDNQAGAATATGTGELVMKTLGSFLIVELMRSGMEPGDACREALQRIADKFKPGPEHQVGYICISKEGKTSACSLREGFEYAEYSNGKNLLYPAPWLL